MGNPGAAFLGMVPNMKTSILKVPNVKKYIIQGFSELLCVKTLVFSESSSARGVLAVCQT